MPKIDVVAMIVCLWLSIAVIMLFVNGRTKWLDYVTIVLKESIVITLLICVIWFILIVMYNFGFRVWVI